MVSKRFVKSNKMVSKRFVKSNKMVSKRFVKYNRRSYRVQKNGTFWSRYTPEDRMKDHQTHNGIKPYPTIIFGGKESRVYEHGDSGIVGKHTFKGKVVGLSAKKNKEVLGIQYATNYTHLDAARDFEKVLNSEGNLEEIPRIWSGHYFFSNYTVEDRVGE